MGGACNGGAQMGTRMKMPTVSYMVMITKPDAMVQVFAGSNATALLRDDDCSTYIDDSNT